MRILRLALGWPELSVVKIRLLVYEFFPSLSDSSSPFDERAVAAT